MSADKLNFIKRVTRVTSLNFEAADFTSLKFKDEIQELINVLLFPGFDRSRMSDTINISNLNNCISSLKSENSANFTSLFKSYNLKGIGPGEVMLFFLINKAYLGGGSSNVDMFVGSEGYEIKAVEVSTDGFAYNFKTGGTVPTSNIIEKLYALGQKHKVPVSRTEINKGTLEMLRNKDSKAFESIMDQYVDIAYNDYFKQHKFIFMRNSGSKMGNIESVKDVKKSDIQFERVTAGVIKPRVKI